MKIYSSEDDSMWEREYFSREFGLTWAKVDPRTFLPREEITFIASDDPNKWLNYMHNARPRSVAFFLLSNETQEHHYFKFFNDMQSICHVFLCYPPERKKIFPARVFIQSLSEFPRIFLEKGFFLHVGKALQKSLQVKNLKLSYSWTYLPLGYSNRFVEELKLSGRLGNDHHGSLLNYFAESKNTLGLRDRRVFFHGRANGWYRRKLLEKYSRDHRFRITFTEKTGVPTHNKSTTLVDGLFANLFALIPPGNVSSLTFRYYEAIICQSIPIHQSAYLQDWQYRFSFLGSRGMWKNTHLELFEYFEKLSQMELEAVRQFYQERISEEIRVVTRQIAILLQNDDC